MARDSERSHVFSRRSFLIGGVQLGLFSLLAGRLYYLEVAQSDQYKTLAEENRINLRLIAPPRGQILDRYGTSLAINQQNYRLVILPDQIKDIDTLLADITKLMPLGQNDLRRIRREIRASSKITALLAKDNLSWDEVSTLSLHAPELVGSTVESGEVRTYPYSETTSHLLGYVGPISKNDAEDKENANIPGFRIGKSGIEKQYDGILRGTPGNVEMEINAHGHVVRELTHTPPIAGVDIALNIDVGLQNFAQKKFDELPAGAAVVMDIHNGQILTLISQPGFNPNLFTYGISEEDWNALNNDERAPLLNKVTSGLFAPGSTFKPVVALAALEAGMVNPTSTVHCPGYLDLGNRRFHCWKHEGHGNVNLKQAMAGSCDTYFYTLGKKVGISKIQTMSQRLGLGKKLGIDMPQERNGVIPNKAWKLATQGSAWQLGETLITAIGQGYVLTTPLQLVTMMARLCNGGMAVKPSLLKTTQNQSGDIDAAQAPWPLLGFDEANLAIVRESMFAVVNEPMGTAYGSRITEKDKTMLGKTGTSQVRHISLSEHTSGVIKNDALPWRQRDHALFIGAAPVDNPRFAVCVVVEHGGSGAHVAAPIARDILLECQKRFATSENPAPATPASTPPNQNN